MPSPAVDAEVLRETEAELSAFCDEERRREAIQVIDVGLARMVGRDLVAQAEVVDLLLDVRSLITPTA
jgi:hypothetical protein